MAQDATGTPTSLGIPKYNTAADSPSGKGFNAAMDAIDALIMARGLPGTPDTNEPVYWNGSAWVTNKLTDTHLDMTTVVPPGIVAMTAAAAAPSGWVICDGSAISRTTFAALFAAIGTHFGVGDGSSTFNVPNLKGRVVVGIDAGVGAFDVRGETGGETGVALTTAQLPAHSHDMTHTHAVPGSTAWDSPGTDGAVLTRVAGNYTANNMIQTFSGSTGGAGSGSSHNNLQPYMALHYIIKL